MKKLNLNGEWILKNCTDNSENSACVPGSDFGALIKNRIIKNPLISGIEEEALKTAENDFEFSRVFTVDSEALAYDKIHITCPCIDTLFDCIINGKKAFDGKNAYVPVDKDVKKFLHEGENRIVFHFYSAYKYIVKRQKENALPKNNNGVDGIPYIRKPGCHFGWDWGPCVPYCGILGDISLECFNTRIENIKISQNTSRELSVITASADNADRIYIVSPSGERIEFEKGRAEIKNPELWYTKELSGRDTQPLYSVIFENGEHSITKKIGLRSLVLDRSQDEYGSNFCFVLNGERIFAKGANVIPFSAIYEDSDNSTVDYYIDLALKSNFNMLRIWGGGSYASDYLLEQCDKKGLLIWQDFCFACELYPFYEKDFEQNVLDEVTANVTRMNTHPCLALWCGNNEIETMFSYMPKTHKLMKAYYEFFYNTLPAHIKDLTEVCYIPTSPIGSDYMKDISADAYGDTHMWNVWHGLKKLDYYQQRYSRFLSEFGLESLPSMKAIKTFAKPNEYDITSPSFNAHQKCLGGNKKMLFYLTEMFDFPKDFSALPYMTGIVQSECIKNATVHFRQNKGRCNGSLFWQFNDVWNCPSWSSVDFEGIPKALQYASKDFFAPVTITCKKDRGTAFIFAHNDTLERAELDVSTQLYSLDGKMLEKKEFTVSLEPNSFKRLDEFKYKKNTVLKISFNGNEIVEIFDAPSRLKLNRAEIKSQIKDGYLELECNTFAYKVFVECDKALEENYISLFPNEKKRIKLGGDIGNYSLMCANNIEYKKAPLKKQLFRLVYRLNPVNIANYVYYSTN